MAARFSRPTAESAWRRRPAERSQWLRPIDAARLARALSMRVVVMPDGTVEFDGTAQDTQFQQKSQQHHGLHEQQGGRKKIEDASPAGLKRGRRQADGLPSRVRGGKETNTREAFCMRQQKKADAAAAAAQQQSADAAEVAAAVAAVAAATAEEVAEMEDEPQQAPTSGPQPAETGTGKRRAVAAAAAGRDAASASGAVMTKGQVAAMTTTGPMAGKRAVSEPRSPRSGVVRPGAAKRAMEAQRTTEYAAAAVKARVHEVFYEIMAAGGTMDASKAAAMALQRTTGELPKGGSSDDDGRGNGDGRGQ